ncbi:G2/M phase-specific E3 ubiquitin-protein ligase-like isoform X2 [Salmo trutta]|uniref:G2/M phase-specific E3 ubiquitin-protein ligase-like isoform X2 n=1 Tax=Salmo trutta TaxID=8032 RepID=UPI001131CCFC|nr:G2/M phase-specific E3 ubiquitin-protein ligase-like isoform X2 [Salmo trutta]
MIRFKYRLNSLGLLKALGNHPDSFRALFVHSIKPPTARDRRDLFKVTYSIPAGNRQCLENDTICHWFNWLAEVQDGECPPLTVAMVLEFATGATVVPPLGFEDTPTIEFLHTARGRLAGQQKKIYPEANTCAVTLRLSRPDQ